MARGGVHPVHSVPPRVTIFPPEMGLPRAAGFPPTAALAPPHHWGHVPPLGALIPRDNSLRTHLLLPYARRRSEGHSARQPIPRTETARRSFGQNAPPARYAQR